MMTDESLSFAEQAVRVIREWWYGARGEPTLAARVLRPLFGWLSVETRIHLAVPVMLGLTSAGMEANTRWGDAGNVQVDGDDLRVGVGIGEAFRARGHGRTWEEAFADADAYMLANAPEPPAPIAPPASASVKLAILTVLGNMGPRSDTDLARALGGVFGIQIDYRDDLEDLLRDGKVVSEGNEYMQEDIYSLPMVEGAA